MSVIVHRRWKSDSCLGKVEMNWGKMYGIRQVVPAADSPIHHLFPETPALHQRSNRVPALASASMVLSSDRQATSGYWVDPRKCGGHSPVLRKEVVLAGGWVGVYGVGAIDLKLYTFTAISHDIKTCLSLIQTFPCLHLKNQIQWIAHRYFSF